MPQFVELILQHTRRIINIDQITRIDTPHTTTAPGVTVWLGGDDKIMMTVDEYYCLLDPVVQKHWYRDNNP